MGRRKVRKCRICKKKPVWRGGDVKNPGPYCKRCYHKHISTGGKGSRRRAAADEFAPETGIYCIGQPYEWMEIDALSRCEPDEWLEIDELGRYEPIDIDLESMDDDEEIPY